MTVPDTAPAISFRPLTRADLARLTDWLNTPHVAAWWRDELRPDGAEPPPMTLEQTEVEYGPDIDAGGPGHEYVILVDGTDVGMIQWYRLADFPEHAAAIGEQAGDAAAVDILIADPAFVGRGVGSRVIDQFVADVVLPVGVDRVVAGPAVGNARSIGAFARAGFAWVRDAVVPDEIAPEHVMVRSHVGPSPG
ncbi:MAG TPA: GNAT family N-acetyltransferase [Acidimicrobiia bacterium]|nr:GNAT family N-acetyltransferase [Acidimicrobiia bacterium]